MRRWRVTTLAVATALALAAPLAPTTASASSGQLSGAGAMAQCVTALASMARTPESYAAAGAQRRAGDTPPVTRADLDAVRTADVGLRAMRAQAQAELPSRVSIRVHFHLINGSHKGERQTIKRPALNRYLAILNNAFAGKTSANGVDTRYRFVFGSVDRTRNDGWYHAYNNGKRDQAAKRRLNKGSATELNLYINGGPRTGGPPVLGWARFPWQRAAQPKLDHVSVTRASLPGGKARNYNLGDTLVHEVGHWMGLFHTFEGGCSDRDQVADTPAEAFPSLTCPVGRDTCSAPGLDPIRNFMNYSYDSCMNEFTPLQVARMDTAFLQYRYGKR